MVQLLIDYVGRHAKALEILLQVTQTSKKKPFTLISMLKDVLIALKDACHAIQNHVEAMKKVSRAVLAHQIVYTSSYFGGLSMDQVVSCGLIQCRGECLFVLYLLLETQGAPWYNVLALITIQSFLRVSDGKIGSHMSNSAALSRNCEPKP